MKRVLTVLRFAVAFVCLLALVTVVVFAQGNDEKAWDDVVTLFNQAMAAYKQARFQDAIDLYEKALVIVRELDECNAQGAILNGLGFCCYSLFERLWAIDYEKQALMMFVEIGNSVSKAMSLIRSNLCCSDLSSRELATGANTCKMRLVLVPSSEVR